MYRTLSALAVLSCCTPASAWDYNFPVQWEAQWPLGDLASNQQGNATLCATSHIGAFELAKPGTPISLSTTPQGDFESPKIEPLNASVTEQWEFDGVSDDGMQSFIFGFYRDPGLSLMGFGNLRLSAELTYANGTRWGRVDYASESTVKTCPDGTRGTWKGKKFSYTFEVSKDMSLLRIGVDTPDLKGNIIMTSRSLPRYADARTWPSDEASTEIAPYFHWEEPIPVGDARVALSVNGEMLKWEGIGGHNRIWAPFNWYTCLKSMDSVRLRAGPYALSYWTTSSRIIDGKQTTSILLMKNGETVFASTRGEKADEDYVLMTKTYGGKVTGTLRDKVTGFELELVSPARKKHWTFIVEHTNIAFEYLLGKGRGGSGFCGASSGGPVGLEQFRGIALTEALTFPDSSPLFKRQYAE
ncbi:hypothetical protein BDV19DRAFT_388787 [Aspergillus venezuelensis]